MMFAASLVLLVGILLLVLINEKENRGKSTVNDTYEDVISVRITSPTETGDITMGDIVSSADEITQATSQALITESIYDSTITSMSEVVETEGTTEENTIPTTQGSITTQSLITTHIHTYVADREYITQPEEGHYEKVCITPGYYEEVYESCSKYCYSCGAVMDDWSFDDLLSHSAIHGSYGTHQMVVDIVWHEAIYEDVWIVDKEEYVQEVITEKCIECGCVR